MPVPKDDPVPEDDIVCRFIRKQDWSFRDNRPKPGAFKQPALSVWHKDQLLAHGIPLEDLRIEHLANHGQALHTVGDYLKFADCSAQVAETPFGVRVEWRPEDEHVAEPWRRWRFAHAQVEAVEGPGNFLRTCLQSLQD